MSSEETSLQERPEAGSEAPRDDDLLACLLLLARAHGEALTADGAVYKRPDGLVIIDSPDFTHRVARRVRSLDPNLPIINYVCHSMETTIEPLVQIITSGVFERHPGPLLALTRLVASRLRATSTARWRPGRRPCWSWAAPVTGPTCWAASSR